jgi:hypothetical protein
MERTQGLNCPSCGGVVPVPEGVRVVVCPFCDQRSLVQGERGVRRWQVCCRTSREDAVQSVKGFYVGINKALDLHSKARLSEVFLVYLPYWRVSATVAGWMFGRVKTGKDKTKPAEVEILEEMHWNDAAVDVSEFGVHRVSISKQELEPFDPDQLRSEAMVFDPTESAVEALAEAEEHFLQRARGKQKLERKFFEKFHLLRTETSLVYHPLWVARYAYRKRSYQVVVDGVRGQVLYGKAPGNLLYRAAAMVVGMAAGTFIMVNGTILAARVLLESVDDEGVALILLPAAIGISLITAGYRAFRYGEEVEQTQSSARKATLITKRRGLATHLDTGLNIFEELSELLD